MKKFKFFVKGMFFYLIAVIVVTLLFRLISFVLGIHKFDNADNMINIVGIWVGVFSFGIFSILEEKILKSYQEINLQVLFILIAICSAFSFLVGIQIAVVITAVVLILFFLLMAVELLLI